MKAKYSSLVSGLAGVSGSNVFFRANSSAFGYIRNYTYPTITAHNNLMGANMKGIKGLWVTGLTAAKADLTEYAALYKNLEQVGDDLSVRTGSPFAIMVKIAYGLQALKPNDIDLDTFVWGDFANLFPALTPCIAQFVSQGILPAVEGWETLTNEFI